MIRMTTAMLASLVSKMKEKWPEIMDNDIMMSANGFWLWAFNKSILREFIAFNANLSKFFDLSHCALFVCVFFFFIHSSVSIFLFSRLKSKSKLHKAVITLCKEFIHLCRKVLSP